MAAPKKVAIILRFHAFSAISQQLESVTELFLTKKNHHCHAHAHPACHQNSLKNCTKVVISPQKHLTSTKQLEVKQIGWLTLPIPGLIRLTRDAPVILHR